MLNIINVSRHNDCTEAPTSFRATEIRKWSAVEGFGKHVQIPFAALPPTITTLSSKILFESYLLSLAQLLLRIHIAFLKLLVNLEVQHDDSSCTTSQYWYKFYPAVINALVKGYLREATDDILNDTRRFAEAIVRLLAHCVDSFEEGALEVIDKVAPVLLDACRHTKNQLTVQILLHNIVDSLNRCNFDFI